MRVLFVNENIGGHATVHHHLRACLAEHPEVAASFLDVPPPSLARRLVGTSLPGLERLDLDLQSIRAQLAASWWVRRRLADAARHVDLVHIYTQNAALLSSGPLDGIPLVVSLDTTNARNAYRSPHRQATRWTPLTVAAAKPFERAVFHRADRVVANSEWAAESLGEDYGLAPNEITVLPFGIVAPALAPVRKRNRLPRIVFVGRQFVAKGGADLLDVFDRELRGRAELVLVTQETVTPTEGVEVISDLKQGDQRLWQILSEADLFAFPSPIDQAPNAVLEAMAAGLPVVAAATAAIPEMVQDGVTGTLVQPGDRPGLASALSELVADPDLRQRFGRAGRRRFEVRYDATRTTSELIEIFAEVLRERQDSDRHDSERQSKERQSKERVVKKRGGAR